VEATVRASWQREFGDDFAGRHAVVTGGSGFIGRHLVGALSALGTNVISIGRAGGQAGGPEGVDHRAVDLRDARATRVALTDARADLVFHLAGVVDGRVDPDLIAPTFVSNVGATVNVLSAVQDLGCARIVLVSSSEAAGWDQGVPAVSPYAASKAAAEMYGRMFWSLYEMPIVFIRPFFSYGPGQHRQKLIPYTISRLLSRRVPVLRSPARRIDLVYVTDVVRGLLMAAQAPAHVHGQRFDVGSGDAVAIRDVVILLERLCGCLAGTTFEDSPAEAPAVVADVRQSTRVLGWAPRIPLEDGLATTVAWSRACLAHEAPLA
jgi:nucleoside-diphosphate-sugar epimerase